MKKELFIILITFVIVVISFSGCISDDNTDIEKPNQNDVELKIELNKSELIINESSINVSITIINKINKKLNLGRPNLEINVTQLNNPYFISRSITVSDARIILNPNENKDCGELIMDTDFFNYNDREDEIIGNYSIIAYQRGYITIISNIEYFNISK